VLEGETTASDNRFTNVVFGGIPTANSDIPNTAGATAQMTSEGLLVLPGTSWVSGATLDIDFSAGLVDLSLPPRSTASRDFVEFEMNERWWRGRPVPRRLKSWGLTRLGSL